MAAEMCRIIKKTPGKRLKKEKKVGKNELEMCTVW
jgi:hypothetical protein